MLKDGEVLGAIVIYRNEVHRFDDRGILPLKQSLPSKMHGCSTICARARISIDANVDNAEPGRTLTDFPGLYLNVNQTTGLKSWVYRYFFQGRIY